MNILSIFAITFQITFIEHWTQSDWSRGEGQNFWSDTTMYYSGQNIDKKVHGTIKLSIQNWTEVVKLTDSDEVHCFVHVGSDTIYAGTGNTMGRLFKSVNGGATWVQSYGEPNYHTINSFVSISSFLYVGWKRVCGNGYIHRTVTDSIFFDVGVLLPGSPYVYSLIESSDSILAGTGDDNANIYKGPISLGGSWSPVATLSDKQVLSLLKSYNSTLYASTGNNNGIVAKSMDNGDNWTECADLPGAKSVYCLCQGGDSAIYAGTDTSGIIYKTSDAGNTWIECGELPLATKVRSLICVPDSQSGDCSYLIAGCECEDDTARAFMSIDNGNNWIHFGAMPGATTPYCLLYTNNGSLLAGTDYNGAIFKVSGFDSFGWLISSVYNTGDTIAPVSYETISWDATFNDSQDVIFRVRTFKDSLEADSLGTDTLWATCPPCTNGQNLSEISSVHYGDPYIQYRVELLSSNLFLTPILEEVRIGYSFGPVLFQATVQGDEIWQDSVITNDQVVLVFSEFVDTTFVIDSSNIDSILILNGNHTWLDSLGTMKSAKWDTTGKELTLTLGAYPTDSTVMPGDTVFPDSINIVDLDSNPCITSCIIGGSFGPAFDSIVAYEGTDSVEYIDNDDYVTFYFSKRTNKPRIDKNNINSILQIPGHTWLDGFSEIRGDSCIWDSLGFALTCSLKIDSLRPTIAAGDTVYSDSVTIWDKFERGVLVSPCVISGTFGEYGPVMTSAIAYEEWPEEPGLGDRDYVEILFNKLLDTIPWSSLDIDTVLIAQANGDTHTWHPESLNCYVQQLEQQDAQGIPYTILYISFKKWGIEEHDAGFTIQSSRLESYPNPFSKVVWIKYQIPGDKRQETEDRRQKTGVKTLNSKQLSPVAVGDTIYPNPNVIKDLKGHSAIKPVVLQGEFEKSQATTHNSRLTTLNSQLLTLNNSKLSTSRVSLRIYNLAGQLVRTLVDEQKAPGEYKVEWDGLDGQGKKVKSGIYFYKLNVNGHILTKKMTLLK
ncbi:T9SS type A sorting domain-containing protein [candidate division WOR-3 bacterium]|nr:T9SS type A sorting domain-containing protein [candidate division WOR-3 bacterium]